MESLTINPNLIQARIVLGEIGLRTGDLDTAIEEGNKVIQANSNNLRAHLILGNAYLGRRDTEKATQHFQEMVRIDPKDPTGSYQLGVTALA